MKLLNRITLSSILFIFSNCGETDIKFNQQKWNKNIDGFYENREKMVNDLLKNHLKKGMKYTDVINLIGKPQNYERQNNTIVYTIMDDYGWDIDPVETKILIITLSKDSLVENYEIKHWKK